MKKIFNKALSLVMIFVFVIQTNAIANEDIYEYENNIFAQFESLDNNNYDDYFTNEHGFYLDDLNQKSTLSVNNIDYSFFEENTTLTESKIEDLISGLISNKEIAFFTIGNTIYRYHIASKTIDEFYSNSDITYYYPITSHSIIWVSNNSKNNRIECLSEIESSNNYYYYSSLDNINKMINNPLDYIESTKGSGYTNILAASYTYRIGNTTLPISGYPAGSVYNGNDNNATECAGFAYRTFNSMWGSYTACGGRDGRWGVNTYSSTQQKLQTLKPGSHIRCNYPAYSSYPHHSMIVCKTTSTNIYVYHGNWTNGQVAFTSFTYTEFANKFPYIEGIDNPHYITSYTVRNESIHSGKCACGLRTINSVPHWNTDEVTLQGTCKECGFYGYIN